MVETKHAQITPTESMNVIWLRTGVLRCRVETLTNDAIVLTPYAVVSDQRTIETGRHILKGARSTSMPNGLE